MAVETRQTADPDVMRGLRAKVVEMNSDIERGTKRLLRAPDDVADVLGKELSVAHFITAE